MTQVTSLILAMNKYNIIGNHSNTIPWLKSKSFDAKADMMFFKTMTTDSTIIMGANTYLSLPNELPNRNHIVISRNAITNPNHKHTTVTPTLVDAVKYAKTLNKPIFIIGGAKTANEAIDRELIDYAFISNINSNNTSSGIKFTNDKLVESLGYLKTYYFYQEEYGMTKSLGVDLYGEGGLNLPRCLYERIEAAKTAILELSINKGVRNGN